MEFPLSGKDAQWLLPFYWAGLVYFAGNFLEGAISEKFRADCSRFLVSRGYRRYLGDLPAVVGGYFEWLFGKRHRSWLCFRRSVIFSTVCFLITLG